ncbi:hypothetical protein MNBD_PLANCTO02-3064 [hydrothermal vent metagenome]|uniref:Uncharacterized protein n=1 Tax=hydrothermal vent metagenome TaxID=652676 RepID=A0A3B1E8Y6_9ZZZZ
MNNEPQNWTLINSRIILILGFFLVGMVVGRMVEANQTAYALATGLAGMVLYVGFAKLEQRKQNKKNAVNVEKMVERLKGRIDKLITRESIIPYSRRFPQKRENNTEQYLPVTHSQKRPKSATRFAAQQRQGQQRQTNRS